MILLWGIKYVMHINSVAGGSHQRELYSDFYARDQPVVTEIGRTNYIHSRKRPELRTKELSEQSNLPLKLIEKKNSKSSIPHITRESKPKN